MLDPAYQSHMDAAHNTLRAAEERVEIEALIAEMHAEDLAALERRLAAEVRMDDVVTDGNPWAADYAEAEQLAEYAHDEDGDD